MTLATTLRDTVRRHGGRPAFQTVGKDAQALTYDQAYAKIARVAGALRAKGLRRGDRVAVISDNSISLALLDWACYAIGLVVVAIYPTLPAEATQYIVKDSGAKLVVVDSEKQGAKVTDSVLITSLDAEPLDLDQEPEGSPEDACAIIYTSGTTGVPKGAVMPHRAFLSVAKAAAREISVTEQDVFLSFLPMSHVYERVAGQILPVYSGSSIVFSKGLAHLATEMKECHPTVVLCIPRFLESLRERILDRVKKDKPIKQWLFGQMLSQGAKKAKGGFVPFAPLFDTLVAKKVREAAGGRLRYFVSGGAALAPEVGEFYMATGLTVLQGYGLTETSGGSVVNRPHNNKFWTVGEPLDVELKLAEDGEILMRGPGIMLGYHNLPEETAAAIDPEGWFHTGDIGEFEGKNLKITDRKKDIIVLGNGKNVAPQKVENLLRTSPLIAEAVVVGDGMDALAALIVPAEGVGTDEAARKQIKAVIDGLKDKLAPFEMVKRFALIDEPFSQENGMLTPTLKVKRKAVAERHKETIASFR